MYLAVYLMVLFLRLAQSALTYSARCYVGSKPRIVPTLLEALHPNSDCELPAAYTLIYMP